MNNSISEWQKHYIDMRKQRDHWRNLAKYAGVIMTFMAVTYLVVVVLYLRAFPCQI